MRDLLVSGRRARVVHVAQTVAGGIASYFEEIAHYQTAKLGSGNVTFVVPGDGDHLASLDAKQLIRFGSASRTPRALIDFARTARAAIQRLRPDIVHLHSSFAGAIVRPLLAIGSSRPRIVYCPHGWAFAMETAVAKRQAYAVIERQLATVTDLIHVNSRSEYELAARFGLPAEKMRVLPNGVVWTPPPARQDREGPIRLAFIGRHDRQKGLDILLETLRRFPMPHIQFDIIGDGILSGGIGTSAFAAPNMRLHGWLSRPQTLALLSHVDAVIMPSRWDAAPMVAIEAMRAGVPVIGSNRGAIPDIVKHGVGGYIFDLDAPASLAQLLQSLDRDDLKRLGTSARERWERHYVSDQMNDLTCEAYYDVLAGSRSRFKTSTSLVGARSATPQAS